jgi:Putative DNA-binding domain
MASIANRYFRNSDDRYSLLRSDAGRIDLMETIQRNIDHGVARFDPGALAPFSASVRVGRGLAARRNDLEPTDILAARYPVIRRVVGDESFRAVARQFMAGGPSRFAAFLTYAETFPRFLRSRGDAVSIEYVADIAELELACDKARRAADARPVGTQAFSPLSLKRLKGLRVELHPSVFLVASRFPIVTIWENNQADDESGMIARWRAEAALVARPFVEVEVRRLPLGGHAFIAALSEGRTVAAAVEAGMAATKDFDIAANLMVLINADIVVGVGESA